MVDVTPRNPYGLRLKNPVMAAAGALGYGLEYARLIDLEQLGGLVTRTTSLRPRRPGPQPRVIEVPSGLIQRLDSHNPGVRHVAEQLAGVWARWQLPVVVSVGGDTAAECGEVVALLEGLDGVSGIELSLAWFGERAAALAALVAVRRITDLPVLVKVPLDAHHPGDLARAAVEAGADALVLAEGPLACAPGAPGGGLLTGRLCGPAIRPLTLRLIALVAPAIDVPVVACGGIATLADARAALDAGAVAVQVGSALLHHPQAAQRLAAALT